jgi:hypothetical protein
MLLTNHRAEKLKKQNNKSIWKEGGRKIKYERDKKKEIGKTMITR